jgi:hypothetical protein
VLSDLDSLTNVDGLDSLFGTSEGVATDRTDVPFHPFLLIPGQEVTASFSPNRDSWPTGKRRDLERKEIHLTGLGVRHVVVRQKGASVEQLWDDVLSTGMLMYGVAADDAHFFKPLPLATSMSAPSRAWVMVRAERSWYVLGTQRKPDSKTSMKSGLK